MQYNASQPQRNKQNESHGHDYDDEFILGNKI